MSDLRVELLAVESCPHFEPTRRALESVLHEGIIETPIQVVFVSSQDDAEFLAFPGSPTIRINGDDVVPESGLTPSLACRLYRDEAGRTTEGPPIEAIRAAVHAHRRGRLEAFQRQEAGRVARYARSAAESESEPQSGSQAADDDPAAPGRPDESEVPSGSARLSGSAPDSESPATEPISPAEPAAPSRSRPPESTGGDSR